MRLSEPMKRELHRIARATTGRGHRGARRLGHLSTHRALERRGLIARTRTRYGRGARFVTWLTCNGRATGKALGLFLVLLALAVGCTNFTRTADGAFKASTFGSAALEATVEKDGTVEVEAEGDGTNVMSIFKGLFDAAARLFGGGGEAPTINITVPQAPNVNVTNPAEVAPTQ